MLNKTFRKKNLINKWRKKMFGKKIGKKYFQTKILITKIYNNINKSVTSFALLAALGRDKEKHRG